MAFEIWFDSSGGAICDKCKKSSTVERPVVNLMQRGRTWSDQNHIMIHEDCLFKATTKVKAESASEQALRAIDGVEL